MEYLAQETIEILKQRVLAHKFRGKDRKLANEELRYWLSQSGLLLRLKLGDVAIELTNYDGPGLQ